MASAWIVTGDPVVVVLVEVVMATGAVVATGTGTIVAGALVATDVRTIYRPALPRPTIRPTSLIVSPEFSATFLMVKLVAALLSG